MKNWPGVATVAAAKPPSSHSSPAIPQIAGAFVQIATLAILFSYLPAALETFRPAVATRKARTTVPSGWRSQTNCMLMA